MVWKGKKEFVRTGNGFVWAGILLWIIGLLISNGLGDDRVSYYIMNSLMLLGLGAVLLGSAIFAAGRLMKE